MAPCYAGPWPSVENAVSRLGLAAAISRTSVGPLIVQLGTEVERDPRPEEAGLEAVEGERARIQVLLVFLVGEVFDAGGQQEIGPRAIVRANIEDREARRGRLEQCGRDTILALDDASRQFHTVAALMSGVLKAQPQADIQRGDAPQGFCGRQASLDVEELAVLVARLVFAADVTEHEEGAKPGRDVVLGVCLTAHEG